jgi:peroxiredoxin/uncharacterized membrane protein YphA (DoxX/SURF4 family)
MGSILLGARILLAAVFATAGVAKLLDRRGTRSALEGFGVPRRVLPAAALLLPLVELGIAVALVPPATAQVAGLAALILLLGFAGGIANAMSRGRAPDCHCFGQLHSAPAGRGTLARNLALAVPAAFVAVEGPGPSVSTWVTDRTGVELAAIAAAVVFGSLLVAAALLWRENRGLRRRLAAAKDQLAEFPPGLPVGSMAPDFALPSATGEVISLGALRARGRPVALVFADPGCGGCKPLLAAVGRWQATLADRLTIAVVSTGSPAENLAAAPDADHVLLQEGYEVAHAYRAWATPATVIVAPNGRVASALVSGPYQAESLIRVTLRQDIGVPAPAPIVAGQRVA